VKQGHGEGTIQQEHDLAGERQAIHRGMDASIEDGLAIEEAAFARIVPTHDAQEGVAAFLERYPPAFLGR